MSVRAVISGGTASGWAREATLTAGLPSQPQSPAAAGGNNTILVSWSPPVRAGGDVTGYTIRWRHEHAASFYEISAPGDALSHEFAVPRNYGRYIVEVLAVNANGTGPASGSAFAVSGVPHPPTQVTATPNQHGRFAVTWHRPDLVASTQRLSAQRYIGPAGSPISDDNGNYFFQVRYTVEVRHPDHPTVWCDISRDTFMGGFGDLSHYEGPFHYDYAPPPCLGSYQNRVQHEFRVKAHYVDNNGDPIAESDYAHSPAVVKTTTTDTIAAAPANVAVDGGVPNGLIVSWDKVPPAPGADPIIAYMLRWRTPQGSYRTSKQAFVAATDEPRQTFIVPVDGDGVTQQVKVWAATAAGIGEESGAVTAASDAPGAPAAVDASVNTDSHIVVSWNRPDPYIALTDPFDAASGGFGYRPVQTATDILTDSDGNHVPQFLYDIQTREDGGIWCDTATDHLAGNDELTGTLFTTGIADLCGVAFTDGTSYEIRVRSSYVNNDPGAANDTHSAWATTTVLYTDP